MSTRFLAHKVFLLILVSLLMVTFGTESVGYATLQALEGPWLWMVLPTGAEGVDKKISPEIDSLAAASDGAVAVTEAYIAENGANEGDTVGLLQWITGPLTPTAIVSKKYCGVGAGLFFIPWPVCEDVYWENNLNYTLHSLGFGTAGDDMIGHTAYALIHLISPINQNGTMYMESGDALKVWLNGDAVYRQPATHLPFRKIKIENAVDPSTSIPDPQTSESKNNAFRVTLKVGHNLLLVKVRQAGEYWDMRVTFDTETDVTTSTVKPQNATDDTQTPVQRATTEAIISISPASVTSPAVGQQLEIRLNITNGVTVAGYQASVQFDDTALRFVSGVNGDFLPTGAFFVQPKVEGNLVKLNAASLAGESAGNGTLTTLTFEVMAVKASTLTLSDARLSNSAGETSLPQIENAEITEITEPTQLKGDVNGDGIVNIADLVLVASNLGETGQNAADVNGDGQVNITDLVLVAGALGNSAAAPSLYANNLSIPTAADVKQWLSAAQPLDIMDTTLRRGILFLQQLLIALTPKETALLPNYPNPFNPETWIPYQLSEPTDVRLSIYAINGKLVRQLDLGHQGAGIYRSRSRAAYWDGRNAVGEPVASGVYFYTLTAGDFTATRKMLIRK